MAQIIDLVRELRAVRSRKPFFHLITLGRETQIPHPCFDKTRWGFVIIAIHE